MADYHVAIFGLGAMGYGMAGALCRAGLTTYGFDINTDVMARFQKEGGAAGTIDDVAEALDTAVIVVVNAAQTEAVLFGADGIAAKLAKGTVVIACATVAPDFAIIRAVNPRQPGSIGGENGRAAVDTAPPGKTPIAPLCPS